MLLPNIHILGIQGSGKGTQSALLEKHYGLNILASGNLLRKRAEQHDEYAAEVTRKLQSGHLFPDEEIFKLVEDYLATTPIKHGLLGDGMMRTVKQYEYFQTIWEKYNLDNPFLIYLQLSDDLARERITLRNQQETVDRLDNSEEAINQRIAMYHSKTEPILNIFRSNNAILTIDATQPIDAVFEAIISGLSQYIPQLKPV